MRFLLDEHLSPIVAARLRTLRHDAVAVADRPELAGLADDRLWGVAAAEDRVLVSFNVSDFAVLATRLMASGIDHPGIVLVPPARFSPGRNGVGRLATALNRLAAASPLGLADRVVWLEAPPEG